MAEPKLEDAELKKEMMMKKASKKSSKSAAPLPQSGNAAAVVTTAARAAPSSISIGADSKTSTAAPVGLPTAQPNRVQQHHSTNNLDLNVIPKMNLSSLQVNPTTASTVSEPKVDTNATATSASGELKKKSTSKKSRPPDETSGPAQFATAYHVPGMTSPVAVYEDFVSYFFSLDKNIIIMTNERMKNRRLLTL